MNFKINLLILLSLTLGGCVTAISARVSDETKPDKLRADSQGVVLVHTSLHQQSCERITMALAQADGSGGWVRGDDIPLKGGFDLARIPSQAVVPAGEYGIVQLRCSRYKYNGVYNARLLHPGRDGSRPIYERPIATFKVGPGEVVDIGNIMLPSRSIREGPFFFGRLKNEFAVVVQPMPEPLLQNLALSHPNLFKARIVRLMTVPPPAKPQA